MSDDRVQTAGAARHGFRLSRVLWAAAGMVVLLWFAREVATVLLLFFFAVVMSIVFSAPVTWLEDRGMNRTLAAVLVLVAVAALAAGLGWLVVPRALAEGGKLVENLPEYADRAGDRIARLLGGGDAVKEKLPLDAEGAARLLPSGRTIATQLTRYSFSFLGSVALFLVFVGMVLYTVIDPRTYLRLYLRSTPPHLREPAARAFARASAMTVSWMWSNVVAGTVEAVATGVVLHLLGVPGAIVWAALAFFAELVPKIGIYIMAVPPVLVALATDPTKALWVVLFYTVMNEVMGDLVIPKIRASTMNIHPTSVLLVMLMMAAAFGLAGALIATPLCAFAKAYYEEFYLSRRPRDPQTDAAVEAMLRRRTPDRPA